MTRKKKPTPGTSKPSPPQANDDVQPTSVFDPNLGEQQHTEPTVDFDQAILAAELRRRQRARASLLEYARSVDIPGVPATVDPDTELYKPVETTMAPHHRLILTHVQQCVTKPQGRLMVLAPPGSAKSTYVSVVTPDWYLSKNPGHRIILTSYAATIAEKQSRKARALIRTERHLSIWPDRPALASDQKAIAQWGLTNGSEFMAAGILGGITGNRANGVIIDDPVAGREEADSETIREKTKEEYRDSVLTRLLPGGWVILVQTRWNEDDLAGSILPEDYAGESGLIKCRDGQTWDVLNIPAKAERDDDPLGRPLGTYLWPEWFPETHWHIWENDPLGQRTWASLYQQRPTAGDGIEFKREWAQWYDPDIPAGAVGYSHPAKPRNLTLYGATDYAVKQDRKADFTEHGIAGMDSGGDLWLTDWWFGQKTSDITISHLILLVTKHRPRKWWHEGGPIGHALTPAMNRAMRESGKYVLLEPLPSIDNKSIKLASFQARMAAGTVHFPLNRAWATRLLDQLCAFPAGRYDDAADVCGLLGRGIDVMMAAHETPGQKPEADVPKPFTGRWIETEDPDDKPRIRFT